MIGRRMVLALPAAFAAWRTAFAADSATFTAEAGDQVAVAARASVSVPPPDGTLEERMEAFIEQSGFGARAARNELFILQGTAPVQVPTTNPDWVRYRQNAYTSALLDAQAKFVAEQNTQILTKTTLDFFKSANETPPPYVDMKTSGQAADVLRKLLAVANGTLDKELQNLGIDPKQFESMPEAQRSAMLTNHLKTSTIERSFGDTVGLCPVMTFEEWTNGAGRIGVVAVSSAIMRDFAQQVLRLRGEFPANPAQAQDLSKLTADKTKLISDFGVRRMFDSQGLPVVVSFAQWASAYRGTDPAMAANYRDAAAHQAEAIADGQIADFLKGSISYDRNSTTGQEIDRIAVSLPDSSSVEDTKRLIDEMQKAIKRTANVNLTGLRTLKVWTGQHPAATDQTIVGVVRMWSAAGEQAMRNRLAPKPAAAAAAASSVPGGATGETQGRKLMNADDF